MSRILIAGCGYVGTALGLCLVEAGHRVFALRRSVDHLPDAFVPVAADLTRPETLAALPSRLDQVVYAAAADRRDEPSYRRAYVEGVANLVRVLVQQAQRIRRFVFVSSTAVYAQHDGDWVDEASPTEPVSFSGRCLLDGETVVRKSPFAHGIVRFAGIYGPGRTRLIEAVRQGASGGSAYTNRIHRDDCAGVLVHLLRLETPAPLYLGVDCEPALESDVYAWLAKRLNISPFEKGGARGIFNRSNKRCSNRKLLESGYVFKYPSYREGYAALLKDRSCPK